MEYYSDETKYEGKDGSCKKIKRYVIVGLEEYNIS